jgi:tungstate transport system ATP-binding protein
MATHTMFQAERLTDEAGFLLEGELVDMGETKEVFGKPKDPRTRAFIKGEMVY